MKRLVRVLVTLVALAVILVAADLGARSYVLRRVAAEVQQEQRLPSTPTVTVAGGSFLLQAARGRFEDVTLTAPAYAGEVELRDVTVRFPHADVPRAVLLGRPATVRLPPGTVRASVPYPSLAERASVGGVDVSLARAGADLRATTRVPLLGEVGLVLSPQLAGDVVQLTPESASLRGREIGLGQLRRLADLAGVDTPLDRIDVSLDGVPGEVRLTRLEVADAGVVVDGTVAASQVPVGG
ncbi:LmeA family phospholipid-binding protein [Kineococcus sp. R8]|uniref:LmeA family phospholipid-binding protein n=1 Tax=Kineococcus siccus TaxID=2696567 RepID=UPI00141331A9|nr:LmeA family phospholipid-binding protein [Kineococcus siccus]